MMILVLPSQNSNFSHDFLEMNLIRCIILETETIKLYRNTRGGYIQLVEQEDEDTRIEIEE